VASQDPAPDKTPGGAIKQLALAVELPFLLVGPAIVGGGIGYFLDRWLHTKPWVMIVLGIAGVAGGLRETIKAASAGDKRSE
jgi:ATP synthase protein I